jgi:hypothetical protein
MFAQLPPEHQPDGSGCEAFYTKITGVFTLDHVEVYNGDGMENGIGAYLEMVVYDQNGIIRCAKCPKWNSSKKKWIYQMQIYGTSSPTPSVYSFKVWNQQTGEFLNVVEDFGEVISYQSNVNHGSLSNLYEMNFTPASSEPEPTVIEGGDWSQDSTWVGNVPEEWADVIINGDVFIPAGYIAYANNITINEGGSLTINEGGELFHNEVVELSIEMNVDGYEATRDENPDNDGYRLIASPVYALNSDPAGIAVPDAMIAENEEDYDLFMFDQTQDTEEWRTYKGNPFTLDLKKGYLYANTEDVFVAFAGLTLPTGIDVTENLVYETSHNLTGWNLLGNPYTATAYINHPFYVLNEAGDEVESCNQGDPIAPMQGFFVQATGENQSCNFSTTPQDNKAGRLNINLSQANTHADRAIVTFGEGKTLSKFQLNPNHTKVYIPQEGKDYAVVNAPEMGEMPVSFKAEKNGTYTLSFTNEEVSFNYLHLIDNMTGIETDLLANPSYSFNAQTTDYASRFKLVFATGNSNDDNFAFYNNGSFVVSNEGNATLQVVDVMGRILTSKTINGSASVNVDAAAGVYMLRLVNGNNVKVQKVVVK